MQAADIVQAIANRFPLFDDSITDNLNVSSLVRSGNTVTVTTDTDHGLSVNDAVLIKGAQTPIPISSISREGTIGTLVASQDHDMTNTVPGVVEIIGANEAEFNGQFSVIQVKNRRTITFSMADSGPTSATGSPLLLNGSNIFKNYNGLQQITATPTPTTFEYQVADNTLYSPASGTITACKAPRVTGSITIDRFIQAYTEQNINGVWLVVVLEDVAASKNRNILSDAVDNQQRTNQFRQQIIQGVSIYAFVPTSAEIAGRSARDKAEELFRPLCQSILFERFATNLFLNLHNPLQFVDHGFESYNTAFYVHRYTFQQVADMEFEDTVGYSDDVAFRDINLSVRPDFGSEFAAAEIDLDDDPL